MANINLPDEAETRARAIRDAELVSASMACPREMFSAGEVIGECDR